MFEVIHSDIIGVSSGPGVVLALDCVVQDWARSPMYYCACFHLIHYCEDCAHCCGIKTWIYCSVVLTHCCRVVRGIHGRVSKTHLKPCRAFYYCEEGYLVVQLNFLWSTKCGITGIEFRRLQQLAPANGRFLNAGIAIIVIACARGWTAGLVITHSCVSCNVK